MQKIHTILSEHKRIQSLIGYALPLTQALFLLLAIRFDVYFFHFTILSFLISDVMLYLFFPTHTTTRDRIQYSFQWLLSFLATVGALFFSDTVILSLSIIACVTAIQIMYFRIVLLTLHSLEERNAVYSGIFYFLLVVFFFTLSIIVYSSAYFLDMPFWYSIVPFLLLFLPMQYAFLSSYTIDQYTKILITAGTAIGATELLYSISWLPLTYLSSAAITSILYACFLDVLSSSFGQTISRRRLYASIIVAGTVIYLVSVLIRWR